MQPRSRQSMLSCWLGVLVASALSFALTGVNAHSTSTAYVDVDSTSSTPALQWRIALRDLDALLDLDANSDGQLTWREVADRAKEIDALAASAITVKTNARICELRFSALRYVRIADAGYAQLDAALRCDASDALTLHYRLFEGIDASHRMLLTMRGAAEPQIVRPGSTVLLASHNSQAHKSGSFAGFLSSGISHIAGGYDHVLFLLCLLLPAVMQRSATSRWEGTNNAIGALLAVVWIATAFTVAHSLTLALATFGIMRIAPSVIEPLIALTIVVTALNNVWPVVTRRLTALAFVFGLIHGFGFAEVLAPLSLPTDELAWALLGFNAGVEIGQLAIVAGTFAVLAMLRHRRGYTRWILRLGSLSIAAVAMVWFVERVFDLTILG